MDAIKWTGNNNIEVLTWLRRRGTRAFLAKTGGAINYDNEREAGSAPRGSWFVCQGAHVLLATQAGLIEELERG